MNTFNDNVTILYNKANIKKTNEMNATKERRVVSKNTTASGKKIDEGDELPVQPLVGNTIGLQIQQA